MKILTGIGSTTHIDRHNERMTKGALDSMVEQIKGKYIPQLIEHDWDRHVGVVLYGEVFPLPDGEHALGIVVGLFENDEEKGNFKSGQSNKVWKNYKKYLQIDELIQLSEKNNNGKNEAQDLSNNGKAKPSIADLLEKHIDSTQVLPDGTVYKIKRFIAATRDLRIEVYPKDHYKDHYPAHFHVISKQRNINARFNIETLELINNKKGEIKGNDVKIIQSFFKTHPMILEELKNKYSRLQQ